MIKPKFNNRTLLTILVAVVILIVVWLIGYFTGIDRNNDDLTGNLAKKEEITEQNTLKFPKLPNIAEKSSTGQANFPNFP